MNYSTKIDLENAIFCRAAQLGSCVYFRLGELLCVAPDVYLQTLIRVYNAFFAEENRYLLEDETVIWQTWWSEYKRRVVPLAGPIYSPDLGLELAWHLGYFADSGLS